MYSKDWHVHTAMSPCCSDPNWHGQAVVDRALKAGLTSIGITDHLFPEMEVQQVIAGAQEIKNAAAGSELKVYISLEVETFDQTGRMKPTAEELSCLDYVLAAAGHLHLDWVQKPRATVQSIIDYHHQLHLALCENPIVDIIAHPWFGLLAQELGVTGIKADDVPDTYMTELCQAAAESGTALELNCSDNRHELFQILHKRLIETAAKFGTTLALGSDAHGPDALDRISTHWPQLVQWGLTEAMLWDCTRAR